MYRVTLGIRVAILSSSCGILNTKDTSCKKAAEG